MTKPKRFLKVSLDRDCKICAQYVPTLGSGAKRGWPNIPQGKALVITSERNAFGVVVAHHIALIDDDKVK